MTRKIILIGGMPTVGKSTVAKELSKRLGLPWMSTDQIRVIMQSVADKDQFSRLFTSNGMTAEQFLEKYTPHEIAQMEYDQSVDVWPGIKTMINNDWTWLDGCIIEGVNIIPSLALRDFPKRPGLTTIILSGRDPNRIRNVVYSRGLFGKASEYSDDVKEREVEWVLDFDELIVEDARASGASVIDSSKNDNILESILRSIE